MKIDPSCVPCLLKRVLYEADLTGVSEHKKTQAVQAACAVLASAYHPDHCSATIATQVHHAVYHALGTPDPYHDLKQRSTQVANSLVPTVEDLLNHSVDRLRTSLLCSVIGNMLDFGIDGAGTTPEELSKVFHSMFKEGFGHDNTLALSRLLAKTHRLLYLTDNCGEHVFDKIVCRELKAAYPRLAITLVVKGVPILSDATLEDATAVRFSDVVDTILTTEGFAVGVPLSPLPTRLAAAFAQADLIIAKGMANYESLSELDLRPIAYLLRTKCTPIAASLQIPLYINALKVIEKPAS
jgi:hypothetical protein